MQTNISTYIVFSFNFDIIFLFSLIKHLKNLTRMKDVEKKIYKIKKKINKKERDYFVVGINILFC